MRLKIGGTTPTCGEYEGAPRGGGCGNNGPSRGGGLESRLLRLLPEEWSYLGHLECEDDAGFFSVRHFSTCAFVSAQCTSPLQKAHLQLVD